MAAYIAIILSLMSIVLFSIVLIKFRKLFSTESIIEKTKTQMNKLISDINKNANMDLDLINESSRRIRGLLKDADLKIAEFKEASDMLRSLLSLVDEKSRPGIKNNPFYFDAKNPPKLKDDIKIPSSEVKKSPISDLHVRSGSAFSYKVNAYKSSQQSLFEEDENLSENLNLDIKNNINNEVKEIDKEDNHDFGLPKIINKIKVVDEEDKPLSYKVEKLYRQGMSPEQIVDKLKCSMGEVHFIISMIDI